MVTRLFMLLAGIIGTICVLLLVCAMLSGATWLSSDEIVFVSFRAINPDLVLLDVDHDLAHGLIHDGAYNVAPAWSPDGQWIAFASDREGRRNIYLVDAVGGNLRRLTDGSGFYSQPRWSATGDRLIFSALNENPPATYSVNLDGSDLQRVADFEPKRGGVSFDPDF